MMRCEEYQEQLSQMLDGELGEEARAELLAHLAVCPECRAMYEAFSAVSDAMRTDAPAVPADLHEGIMRTLRHSAVRRRRRMPVRLRPYMAAAACLVVIAAALLTIRLDAVLAPKGAAADASTNNCAPEAAVNGSIASGDTTDAEAAEAQETAEEESGNPSSPEAPAEGTDDGGESKNEELIYGEAVSQTTLDIVSAVLTTRSADAQTTEALSSTDAKVWLLFLLESGFQEQDGHDQAQYELKITPSEGADYTVWLFYESNTLRASFSQDGQNSCSIQSLEDFADFIDSR